MFDAGIQEDVTSRRIAEVLEHMISRAPDQWVVLQRVWDREYTDKEGSEIRDQGSAVKDKQIVSTPEIQVPSPSL